MLVDAHCHIWRPEWIDGDLRKVLDSVNDQMKFSDRENIFNGSLERLIADMDEAGIEKTVLLPLDYEFLYSGVTLTYRDYNDFVGEYIAQYPDRLIGFAGVDPRRGAGAVAELRRCVEDLGFSGLKLWTITGFAPDDEAFYPLYEEAARLGATVMVHTGMGPGFSYLKTCRPIFVDKVAVDFRQINFIMAHMGTPWLEEAVAVSLKNPNVYLDISAWQKTYSIFPLALVQALAMVKLMHGGIEKVLFGTDWPLFTELYSQKEWVEIIRSFEHPVPLQVMGLPEITPEDREMILGENARAVLGI